MRSFDRFDLVSPFIEDADLQLAITAIQALVERKSPAGLQITRRLVNQTNIVLLHSNLIGYLISLNDQESKSEIIAGLGHEHPMIVYNSLNGIEKLKILEASDKVRELLSVDEIPMVFNDYGFLTSMGSMSIGERAEKVLRVLGEEPR